MNSLFRPALRAAALLAVAMAVIAAGGPAEARTNHALLVAVTAYPNLPPKASLIGPNNDAALVREYLTTSAPTPFDPANVTVLADGLGDARSPTLEAITAALEALAGRVESGDFVYLHFSGHGTQQPATDPASEPDGLDEIFLPADTGLWKDRNQGVPQALQDDVIGAALQRIRDKGAFVWIVIDACHSGTATRAASTVDEDITERKVDPADLGIPDAAMSEAAMAAEGSASRGVGEREAAVAIDASESGAGPATPGGMVAFFAAQTVETTPEMVLPRGAPDGVKLGLFTYTVFSKLAENPNVTYRQLAQSVLQAYSGDNRTRPTPLFEGQLDTRVFGLSGEEIVPQWAVRVENGKVSVPAGRLHRLSPGARLALLPSPASASEDALGYLEVRSSKNLTSELVPVAHEGRDAVAIADIPDNAYARLVELAIDFSLAVARPPDSADYGAEVALVNQALDRIVGNEETPVNLRIVEPGAPADIRLAVMSEMDVALIDADRAAAASRASLSLKPHVWFLPPTAEISLEEGRRPPSIRLGDEAGLNLGADPDGGPDEKLTAEISNNLVLIFRATNLSRLAVASDYRPEEVSVAFKIKPSDSDGTEPLAAGTVPIVHPGDQVHIEGRNASPKPVDINVLYIGSDYSITHMYAERLHGGSELDIPLLEFTDTSYGIERMVVVLTEALPQTPVEDLSFLEQVGVRMLTRDVGAPEGFSGLLRDLSIAPGTRSAAKLTATADSGGKGAVLIYPLETTPRPD